MPPTTTLAALVADATFDARLNGGELPTETTALGKLVNDDTYSPDLVAAITDLTGTRPRNPANARALLRRMIRNPHYNPDALPADRTITLRDLDNERAWAERATKKAIEASMLRDIDNGHFLPDLPHDATDQDWEDYWHATTAFVAPHSNPGTSQRCAHSEQPYIAEFGPTCPVCHATVTIDPPRKP